MKHKIKKQEVKAVIFDFGDVLYLGKHPKGVHLHMAKKFNISLDIWLDAIAPVIEPSTVGKISYNKTVKIIANNTHIDIDKLKKAFAQAYKKNYKKNKVLFELAFKLKKKGYIIGVLSDQWAVSKKHIANYKNLTGFNLVIISCDVGIRKPNVRIYKLLIKKLKEKNSKIRSRNIVFIDNKSWNLNTARKIGINTILFKNNNQLIKDLRKNAIFI